MKFKGSIKKQIQKAEEKVRAEDSRELAKEKRLRKNKQRLAWKESNEAGKGNRRLRWQGTEQGGMVGNY